CRTNKTCWTDRKVPPFAFDSSRNVLWLVEDGKIKRLIPAHVTHSDDVRYGACGVQFDASRQIMAAVSHTFWTQTLGKTRLDPLCNQCVDVTHKGKTVQVPIKDKCLVCESSHVDLSLPAFTMLDSRVKARLEGAVYEIVECDGNTTLFPASISVWPRSMTIGVTLSFVAFVLAATAATTYLGIRHYMTGKEWEIPFEQVQMEEQIGQGSFGVVFRAYRYGPVAVKQLFAAKPQPSQRRAFRNEIRLLKSLRHTNVLGLLGVVTEPKLAI
ncbi:expansin B, partial [Aphelenchoides avenae]